MSVVTGNTKSCGQLLLQTCMQYVAFISQHAVLLSNVFSLAKWLATLLKHSKLSLGSKGHDLPEVLLGTCFLSFFGKF